MLTCSVPVNNKQTKGKSNGSLFWVFFLIKKKKADVEVAGDGRAVIAENAALEEQGSVFTVTLTRL